MIIGRPMAQLKYDQRFVAYIDILGWKETIAKSVSDASELDGVAAALKHMRNPVRRWEYVKDKARVWPRVVATQFSDTVVLSDEVTIGGAFYLAHAVQELCWGLLLAGHLTRGAVVKGDLYHDGSVVLGPALISAYQLETSVAKYPRIVLAPDIQEFLQYRYIVPDESEHEAAYVRVDFDGVAHLHLVDIAMVRHIPAAALHWEKQVAAALDLVRRKQAAEGGELSVAELIGIRAKNCWMESYLLELEGTLKSEAGKHPVGETAGP